MASQDVNEKLKQLHTELGQTETTDEKSQAVVGDLQENIQTVLDKPPAEQPEHYESLRERLDDAALHFEVSHPALAEMIEDASSALGGIGI